MIPRNRPIRSRPEKLTAEAPDPSLAPPAEQVKLTDIDIQFRSGKQTAFTLTADDVLDDSDPDQLTIKFASGELVLIYIDSIEFISRRTRRVVKPAALYKPTGAANVS